MYGYSFKSKQLHCMRFLNVSEYVNLAKLEDQLKHNNCDDIQSEVTLFILNYNSDLTFHKKNSHNLGEVC